MKRTEIKVNGKTLVLTKTDRDGSILYIGKLEWRKLYKANDGTVWMKLYGKFIEVGGEHRTEDPDITIINCDGFNPLA